MRVLPLPSFEAVLDGEVGEKEGFLTGLTVAESLFPFAFLFFLSPLTRERHTDVWVSVTVNPAAGGGFSSDIRLGRYQGLVHVDDLTGLSLEVLLFVEIAVRRPFEGKAVHSTSGLLSLEHDDEQEGFVHLTFVHARHGRTSPCSCNQGVAKTRVSRKGSAFGKRGQKKRGCYRGRPCLEREEQVPCLDKGSTLVAFAPAPYPGNSQRQVTGDASDWPDRILCVALHHTPSWADKPLDIRRRLFYMISFFCHWRGKFTAYNGLSVTNNRTRWASICSIRVPFPVLNGAGPKEGGHMFPVQQNSCPVAAIAERKRRFWLERDMGSILVDSYSARQRCG